MSIKKLFDRAYVAARQRSYTRGILGAPDGTLLSTARPDMVNVRVSREGAQSVTLARHLGRVPLRVGLPVRMIFEEGAFVIEGVDSYYYSAATASDAPNVYGLPKHTHRTETGLEYETESKLLSPGRVYWNSGLSVYVSPLRYYAGGWQYFDGGSLSLAAHVPTTSTKWWWVLVGINPTTNAAVAAHGAEYATAADLTLDLLSAITFTGYIPLVAIKVANGDTDLSEYTRYFDASEWHGLPSLSFSDSEGDPANVATSAADGTSAYAARRDHVHALADAVVTLAKMANLAKGYFIGRSTTGTGVPEAVNVESFGLQIDSGALKRSALTGDVLATLGSNATTIGAGAVSNGKFRSSAALSAIANPTNGAGSVADVSTTASSNAVLMEQGSALVFDTIATANIDDGAITNAKQANMLAATVKGRVLGGGTGAPSDMTGTQVAQIAGGVIYKESPGAGNITTGEDTIGAYTVTAGRVVGGTSIWFEAAGRFAANGNTKRIRVYFGATTLLDVTTTVADEDWFVRGRLVVMGSAVLRTTAEYMDTGAGRDFFYTEHTDDLTTALDLVVTGEATGTDDIVLRTMLVGWTPGA